MGCFTLGAGVPGSNVVDPSKFPRSIPVTLVTDYSGDMGNTFGRTGWRSAPAGTSRRRSSRDRSHEGGEPDAVAHLFDTNALPANRVVAEHSSGAPACSKSRALPHLDQAQLQSSASWVTRTRSAWLHSLSHWRFFASLAFEKEVNHPQRSRAWTSLSTPSPQRRCSGLVSQRPDVDRAAPHAIGRTTCASNTLDGFRSSSTSAPCRTFWRG